MRLISMHVSGLTANLRRFTSSAVFDLIGLAEPGKRVRGKEARSDVRQR